MRVAPVRRWLRIYLHIGKSPDWERRWKGKDHRTGIKNHMSGNSHHSNARSRGASRARGSCHHQIGLVWISLHCPFRLSRESSTSKSIRVTEHQITRDRWKNQLSNECRSITSKDGRHRSVLHALLLLQRSFRRHRENHIIRASHSSEGKH